MMLWFDVLDVLRMGIRLMGPIPYPKKSNLYFLTVPDTALFERRAVLAFYGSAPDKRCFQVFGPLP